MLMDANGYATLPAVCWVSIMKLITRMGAFLSYPFLLFDISSCLTYRGEVVWLEALQLGSILICNERRLPRIFQVLRRLT
jgi:hypothetical protein